jgi:predicted transglutaminase-like cysteine proteinase
VASFYRSFALTGAAALLASCSSVGTIPSGQSSGELFAARVAISSTDLGPFQRWHDVNARYEAERSQTANCSADDRQGCPGGWWAKFIAGLQALPPRERVTEANAALNQIPYVPAETNWGNAGYWEAPYEFLSRGGQCQDYAIAKYHALIEAGIPETQLRFVVVRDTARGLDHAVTVATVDGESLVLDNQAADAEPVSQVHRYAPYYALNSQGWSAYLPPNAAAPARVQLATMPGQPPQSF